jgi:hypothetical protein
MIYKLLKIEDDIKIYARINDDGLCRVTCTENNPDYLEWISQGNTPLPADEVKA